VSRLQRETKQAGSTCSSFVSSLQLALPATRSAVVRSGAKAFPLFRAVLLGPAAEREEKKAALYMELKAMDAFLTKHGNDVSHACNSNRPATVAGSGAADLPHGLAACHSAACAALAPPRSAPNWGCVGQRNSIGPWR
jgi:hypothetical protein